MHFARGFCSCGVTQDVVAGSESELRKCSRQNSGVGLRENWGANAHAARDNINEF